MDDESPGVVLVSACLLGFACRYDGTSKSDIDDGLINGALCVPICPEQMGGLPTPRDASVFIGGHGQDVIAGRARLEDVQGRDVTQNFILGALHACRVAELVGADRAILKEKSPSCGTHMVTVDGLIRPGIGVTAAMFLDSGMQIMNEEGIAFGQEGKGIEPG
ncbi:MAG: DUF523 domain-containing protein [Thermodesulfobacteriota bacterium]|nr:DUF523 domain-containing protein [Thermodesulfobacteriota bacterium]